MIMIAINSDAMMVRTVIGNRPVDHCVWWIRIPKTLDPNQEASALPNSWYDYKRVSLDDGRGVIHFDFDTVNREKSSDFVLFAFEWLHEASWIRVKCTSLRFLGLSSCPTGMPSVFLQYCKL